MCCSFISHRSALKSLEFYEYRLTAVESNLVYNMTWKLKDDACNS
jgi:hypothetical protein